MKKILSIITALVLIFTAITGIGTSVLNAASSTISTTALVPAPTFAPNGVAELPRVYLDTNYSEPSGNIINVKEGDDLQAAINSANPGDIIEIEAGASFIGNYTLPNKTGNDWIYIRSSAYSSLPAPNNRISPNDAANMPKILSPDENPAIIAALGSHNYRLVGIEIATTNNIPTPNIVLLDSDSNINNLPHDLTFDRCYVHGSLDKETIRGILLNGASISVIDSYISDIHHILNDSQALCGWNGSGPFKIVNNFLEAAGENTMFGGGDPAIKDLVASDIEFRGNHCYKPISWHDRDPSYTGRDWAIKNIFELKCAQRVLADGNIFENNFASYMGLPAPQAGGAIVLTVRNQDGGNPNSVVQDVTFTNNIIRHTGVGLGVMGGDDAYPSRQANHFLIRNNLFYDIDPIKYGTTVYMGSAGGAVFEVKTGAAEGVLRLVIDHNTADYNGGWGMTFTGSTNAQHKEFVFTNNIFKNNRIIGNATSYGMSTIEKYCPGYVFDKNILPGGTTKQYPNPGTYLPATFEEIGFVNLGESNYQLAPTSIYKNLATDGKDIGTDISELNARVQNVVQYIPPLEPMNVTPTPKPTATPAPVSSLTPAPVQTQTSTSAPVTTPTASLTPTPNTPDVTPTTTSAQTETPAPVNFTDIGSYDWAKESIMSMAQAGILKGMGNDLFAPQNNLTRAEFSKIIIMLMGYDNETADSNFSDVQKDQWFYPYVSAAYAHGIIKGKSATTFDPGANITRQDMAVIIARALNITNTDVEAKLAKFTDNTLIADYAREAVAACVEANIIHGYTDGTFGPHGNATRAEAAVLTKNVYDFINK